MKVWQSILITVGVIALFTVMGIMLFKIYDLEAQQAALQTQVVQSVQLANGITRAMATYATKADIQDFASKNDLDLQAIQDDLSKLSATLTSVNQVSVNSVGQKQTGVASTTTTPRTTKPPTTTVATTTTPTNSDPYNYQKNRQMLAVNEKFTNPTTNKPVNVPFGQVGFSAWLKDPWDINIAPRTYKATTVIGTDTNNRQYAYNKFTIAVNGTNYPVKIANDVVMQQPLSNTFSWWSPHIYLTAGGAADLNTKGGDANVGLTFGALTYGSPVKGVSPLVSIGQLGLGFQVVDQRPSLILNPVMFNVGKLISPSNSVISNTFLGPSLQGDIVNAKPILKLGANLSLGF